MRNMKALMLKSLGIILALSAVLAISTVVLAADSYPNKPVRFIVPIAPGGGPDTFGRLVATKLSERLGKPVIVENHSGAGGIIGTEMVAKADPDGYTLLVITTTHVIQPALQKLPYDPIKSFTPIAMMGSALFALVVHPSVPANSVKELIALAKQKPGQLVFATSGPGSIVHMVTELFKIKADIDIKIVHFKGGGPAVIDVLGGHSHATLGQFTTTLSHIKSGKLRALATSGVKRSSFLPDLPTITEAGVPGITSATWWGFLAPAGTPAPIVNRLNKEIKEILAMDEVKQVFLKGGAEADYTGATEFATFLEAEVTQWAQVIKKANIKME